MKNFAKLLVIPALIALPFLRVLPVAHAQNISEGLENVGGAADLSQADLTDVIGSIINTLLTFLGIIFLVLVLYAGFLWMTAGGNEGQIEKAQQLMKNGVIGLIILLAAYSISSFVINALVSAGLGA